MVFDLVVERTLLKVVASFLLLSSLSHAAYNETLDDAHPSITYSPTSTGRWNDQTCPAAQCWAQPIRSSLYSQSWHEFTYKAGDTVTPLCFTVNFTGTAIDVFAVYWERPRIENDDIDYNFTYALDGRRPRSFYRKHEDITAYTFTYNQSVVQFSDLEDAPHVLNVTLNENSFFMLDYIVVTHSGSDPAVTTTPTSLVTSTSSTNGVAGSPSTPAETIKSSSDNSQTGEKRNNLGVIIGSIVGGVLGGMLIMASILGGLVYRRRQRKRREHLVMPTYPQVTPFHQHLDIDSSLFSPSLGKSSLPSTPLNPYDKSQPTQENHSVNLFPPRVDWKSEKPLGAKEKGKN